MNSVSRSLCSGWTWFCDCTLHIIKSVGTLAFSNQAGDSVPFYFHYHASCSENYQDSRESLTARKVTALMNAARSADDDAIIKLFLEALDLSFADGDGNTALHLAAKCQTDLEREASGDRASPLGSERQAVLEDSPIDPSPFEYTRWNDELIANTTEWKPNGKVLLALDGGGVKSLVLTQILLYLEDELNGNFLPRIDWIAGTSSGGVTALMLCHGMEVN
ncbi:unnamed protein product [Haemonchus placei]|uniref:PNPLA domain-containing protein n=1 Tax=Haemonchus placei TaxID=6290 RepID=A0A0N4XAK8_HAEPC|nr:unnamed protein product [Haemonchus placei]